MSIGKRMAKGVAWVVLEKGGQQALMFATFLIVARLVGPREFGLFSLCQIFATTANIVLLGIVDGVISRRLTENRDLSTVFWAVTGLGFLFSLAGFLAAPLFASLVGEPGLQDLLEWISPYPLLCAISNVPTMLVQARMHFRIFTLRSILSTGIGGAVGIVMAMRGYGALSIVAQMLVQQSVVNCIIWPGAGWLPGAQFDRSRLKYLLAPGMKLSASYAVEVLESQLPRLFIGQALGTVAVGYYAFVFRIWQTLRDMVILPVSTVFFPALSQIRDDAAAVRSLVENVVFFIGLILLPMIAGLAVMAPEVITLMFGAQWAPTAPLLRIYLCVMAASPILVIIRAIARIQGQMSLYLALQCGFALTNLAVIWLLREQGLAVILLGQLASAVIWIPTVLAVMSRRIDIRPDTILQKSWRTLLSAAAMGLAILGARTLNIATLSPISAIALETLLGMAVFLVLCLVFQRDQLTHAVRRLRRA